MWIHYQGKQYAVQDFIDTFDDVEPLDETVAFLLSWPLGPFPLQTSGSTGPGRTFVAIREQILASVANTADAFDLQAGMTVLMPFHPRFVASKMIFARAMALGLNVVVIDPVSNPLQNHAALPPIDFASLVPYQMTTILQENPEVFQKIPVVLLGGAPLPPRLEQQCQHVDAQVFHGFGMTETLSHVAVREVNGPNTSDTYTTVGENKVRVNDNGCLEVMGAVTQQRWLTTTDLVDAIDSHHFRWVGRSDWVINSGGIKISPEAVERVLYQQEVLQNRNLVVCGKKHPTLGEELVVVIEGDPTDAIQFDELSRYEQPRDTIFMPNLPRTSSGKIDRLQIQKIL